MALDLDYENNFYNSIIMRQKMGKRHLVKRCLNGQ